MRRLAGIHAAFALVASALGAQTAAPPAAVVPAAATAPVAAAAPAPEQPAVDPLADRIAFEFRVPTTRGGGVVTGTAGAVETSGESEAILTGGVEIKYRDLSFRAERVRLHRETLTAEAEGDVIFDQATRRIAAQRAEFDLATETGTFWKAAAFAEPDQYFSAEVLVKTGEQTYEIQDGVITSCTGDPTPDWSFRIAEADIELGGYAHLKHARMRMKKAPLFYWPYMIWPAKLERSSGFLIPNIGYNETRGALLGLAYYQVMGPSADLTLHADLYEKQYFGAGAELRYAPAEGTKGRIVYQYLQDRDLDQAESRFTWQHETARLPGGFRGVVDVNDYSDYEFFRQFQRGERENTRAYLYSNAFVSGNWGAHSLSMIIDQRESLRGGQASAVQRQLPEVAYRLRKLRLGSTPLYLSLDSNASLLQTSDPGKYDVDYGRFDVAPELTVPLKVAPWLSVAISAGGRATWWGESVPTTEVDAETGLARRVCDGVEVAAETAFCGESISRTLSGGSLAIVGPSFSKILESPGGRFGKFKHIVEPRFTYGYASEFEDDDRIARFDEIDRRSSSTNSGRAALVNRILAKPSNPEEGGAFEILSFELSQDYVFEQGATLQRSSDGLQTSQSSPLFARLRYSPSRSFDLQSRVTWSTLFSSLQSTSLSLRGKAKRVGVDLTWYSDYDPETATRRSDQTRLGFDVQLIPQRLSFGAQVNYDLQNSELQQHSYLINYVSQCWSAMLSLREQTTSSFESRDVRFMLSLKNVGTFLDLNSGGSNDR